MEQRQRVQLEARGKKLDDARAYEVTLIEAGRNKNGYDFPTEVLRDAAPLFNGATSFCDHSPLFEHPSVRNVLGVVSASRIDAGDLVGTLTLAHDDYTRLLDFVVEQRAAGKPAPNVGMSADILFQFNADQVAEKILNVFSVDLVFDPAAGGEIRRILNSAQGGKLMPNEDSMTPQPQPAAGEKPRTAAQELLRLQCAAVLQGALNAANDLPDVFKEVVREQFADKVFDADDLTKSIERQRKLYAAMTEQSVVRGVHATDAKPKASGVQIWSDLERLQFATDLLFGLDVPEAHKDTPRLRGIQELYLLLSGDREMRGMFHGDRVQFANATSSTMAALVANAMNKVIAAQWHVLGLAGYNWFEKVFYQDDMTNLNDVRWNTVGGFGDLPTVSEGAAYTELAWDDKVETSSFVKKGGFIGLTLEMMDKDETRKVKQIPVALATAGIRTLSSVCAALWSVNSGAGPTLADSGAWFQSNAATRGGDGATAASGNLATTALSAAEFLVRANNIFKQAELNSSKRLGLRPRYCLVPIDLERTARDIFQNDWLIADNKAATNLDKGACEVVTVPDWTDKTDWALVTDPNVYPVVGIGYRYGRKPEVFIAGDDNVGSMFTNDEMRIKTRFFFAAGVIDWRGTSMSHVA